MAQSDLSRTVEPACQRLADELGFELVDVELVREGANRYLRIYISKPDGINLDDCETYHRAVMPLVERVDYDFLEVCSPGLDRPLKKQKDYDANVGNQVEIHLYKPVDRCRRFEGELLGLEDGVVSISTAAGDMRFALKDISLCKPVVVVTEEELAQDVEGETSDDGQNRE